jgi:hypothetical protein
MKVNAGAGTISTALAEAGGKIKTPAARAEQVTKPVKRPRRPPGFTFLSFLTLFPMTQMILDLHQKVNDTPERAKQNRGHHAGRYKRQISGMIAPESPYHRRNARNNI